MISDQGAGLNLIQLLELVLAEEGLEERLHNGRRLRGPRTKTVIDESYTLGLRDEHVEPEAGYSEFQHWLSVLIAKVRAAAGDGKWVFRGVPDNAPIFPTLEPGYIRHAPVDLLQNQIGQYRAIEVSLARPVTDEERCIQVMRRAMTADPNRELRKPQIEEIVRASVPSLKAQTFNNVWTHLANTEFPDRKTKGPRPKGIESN